METKVVRCTTCGYQLNINEETKVGKCDACGNSFVVEKAIDFNLIDRYEASQIKRLRLNLERSARTNSYDNMTYYAQEILKLIPTDFVSRYFEGFAAYKLKSPDLLYDFYQDINQEATKAQIKTVTDHILKNSDVKDRKMITSFLEVYAPSVLINYSDLFDTHLTNENNYAPVPRDIFICYRSVDEENAMEVVRALEKDGNTCWISSRNLRPNDHYNYWDNIEQAIKNCKAMVVISSQDAMVSQDVQKEMRLAKEIKRAVLEYKIDDSTHTIFFKHYFDGRKWVDAYSLNGRPLQEVCERVYVYKQKLEYKETPKPKQDTPKKANPYVAPIPVKKVAPKAKPKVEENRYSYTSNSPHHKPRPKTNNSGYRRDYSTSSGLSVHKTYYNDKGIKIVEKYRGQFELKSRVKAVNANGKRETVVTYYDSRVAFMLSILPWGLIGLDKFYAGKVERGIIGLFTLQLFFVGWFQDSLEYLTKVMSVVQLNKGVKSATAYNVAKKQATWITIGILVLFLMMING